MIRYDFTMRVWYRDTDQMGIVHHSNYLGYYEAARSDMLRALGMSFAEVEKRGIMMPVPSCSIRVRPCWVLSAATRAVPAAARSGSSTCSAASEYQLLSMRRGRFLSDRPQSAQMNYKTSHPPIHPDDPQNSILLSS